MKWSLSYLYSHSICSQDRCAVRFSRSNSYVHIYIYIYIYVTLCIPFQIWSVQSFSWMVVCFNFHHPYLRLSGWLCQIVGSPQLTFPCFCLALFWLRPSTLPTMLPELESAMRQESCEEYWHLGSDGPTKLSTKLCKGCSKWIDEYSAMSYERSLFPSCSIDSENMLDKTTYFSVSTFAYLISQIREACATRLPWPSKSIDWMWNDHKWSKAHDFCLCQMLIFIVFF